VSALERLLVSVVVLAVLATGGWLGLEHYGAARYDAGRAAAIAERAQADKGAIQARTTENATEAVRQVVSNATITEKKHEEIAPVRERIVTQRVYVGAAVCGDRPAAPAQAESAAGSDSTNPPGRLVRPDVERDLVALKLAVEEDLATGRACQATLRENGMAP
jgi:hypothetical protein